MYNKDEITHLVPTINQLTFFVTYTIFRIMSFPFVCCRMVLVMYYVWDTLPIDRKGTATFAFVFFFSLWILMLIWYRLILKAFYRAILGALGYETKSSKAKNAAVAPEGKKNS
jgi:hypothetical protein